MGVDDRPAHRAEERTSGDADRWSERGWIPLARLMRTRRAAATVPGMDLPPALARYGDAALAAGLGAVFAVEMLFEGTVAEGRPMAAAVGVVMAVSLSVRRTAPLVPLCCAVMVILLSRTVLVGMADSGSFLVALLVALFSAGRYGTGPARVLAGAIAAGIIPLAALDPTEMPTLGDWVFFVAFIGTTYGGGLLFRARHERDLRMAERAERAERAGESRAAEAVALERTRIARELHDVVAHAIGVIVVQSRAGRRVLAQSPGEAAEAFDAIERSGEQALAEMRRLLALLPYDEEAGLAPQPGIDRLDELAAAVSAAGLPVEVVRTGEPVALSPGLDLSAYRIVQEALTNVLKHAGPARARVHLRYRPDDVEVEVTDDGDGSGAGGGSGRGLAGIRERVSVYGGEMIAEPAAEGGYVVRARLPLGRSA